MIEDCHPVSLWSVLLSGPSPVSTSPANTLPSPVKTEAESVPPFQADQIVLSPDLEKELCLAINRELHVSYCYLVMGGIFTRYEVSLKVSVTVLPRQGLKSFSGMCSRQEDYHRGCARELLHHVTTRGGKLRLADIAEPGTSCSTVSCAEAVRVALRLEQWILEGFSSAQEKAEQVGSCL